MIPGVVASHIILRGIDRNDLNVSAGVVQCPDDKDMEPAAEECSEAGIHCQRPPGELPFCSVSAYLPEKVPLHWKGNLLSQGSGGSDGPPACPLRPVSLGNAFSPHPPPRNTAAAEGYVMIVLPRRKGGVIQVS